MSEPRVTVRLEAGCPLPKGRGWFLLRVLDDDLGEFPRENEVGVDIHFENTCGDKWHRKGRGHYRIRKIFGRHWMNLYVFPVRRERSRAPKFAFGFGGP